MQRATVEAVDSRPLQLVCAVCIQSAAGLPGWRCTRTSSPLNRPSLQHLAEKKLVEKRHQLEQVDQLKPIAEELGCTLAQVGCAIRSGAQHCCI